MEETKETKELDKIAPEKVTLKIKGKDREIKFNFSAWAIIEKEYGGIKNIEKMEADIQERPFEIIPHLMYIALVDKEGITEENILDDYGLGDMNFVAEVFRKALYGSLPQDDNTKKEVVKEA